MPGTSGFLPLKWMQLDRRQKQLGYIWLVAERRKNPSQNRRETVKFTRPDLNSLVLCISALIFLSDGIPKALHNSCDFVNVYSGARCLLHGCNPYDTSQLDQQYSQAGGRADERLPWYREVPMYPPSTFLVLSPLTLFRFPVARVLWSLLNGCLYVISAGLILP